MECGSGPLRSLNTALQVHPSPCSGTSRGCPRLHLHSFSWLLHACLSLAASPSYYLPVHSALRLSTDRICDIRLLFKTTGMVEGSCSRNRSSVRVHLFFSHGLVNFWNLPFPTPLWVGGGLMGITSVLFKPKVFFSCAFENININRFFGWTNAFLQDLKITIKELVIWEAHIEDSKVFFFLIKNLFMGHLSVIIAAFGLGKTLFVTSTWPLQALTYFTGTVINDLS